jgi:hypothetical protein
LNFYPVWGALPSEPSRDSGLLQGLDAVREGRVFFCFFQGAACLRPYFCHSMKKVLEAQQSQMANFQRSYVFLNMEGRPIVQDKLRELWMRAMKKSQLLYQTVYAF